MILLVIFVDTTAPIHTVRRITSNLYRSMVISLICTTLPGRADMSLLKMTSQGSGTTAASDSNVGLGDSVTPGIFLVVALPRARVYPREPIEILDGSPTAQLRCQARRKPGDTDIA
ncbi:hypothetical protein QAD02_012517 [Eretmocerus hayati]|uniref:Uncharacterized protein n=1 Tax=Eretmocerus hayati TaxID=131215 RepID=A0ACC2NZX2_9HYME|nr:hypothetical protein QAD02_012517 [Eretmocerus hayati]